jgi:HEAT repeat protein
VNQILRLCGKALQDEYIAVRAAAAMAVVKIGTAARTPAVCCVTDRILPTTA